MTVLKKKKPFVCIETEAGLVHRKVGWEHDICHLQHPAANPHPKDY